MLVSFKLQNFCNSFGGSKVKTLRQISATSILSLMLSVCVLAGQIESNGAPSPPQPPNGSATQLADPTTGIVLTVIGWIYS
jgi:hypothetical protein